MGDDDILGCGCLGIVALVIVAMPIALIWEYPWLIIFVIIGIGIYLLYLNNTVDQRRERRQARARAQEQEKRAKIAAGATLNAFDSMAGVEFEEFMADFFRHVGYEARTTPGSGDQGMDLFLQKGGRTVAVQAKRYSSPVGNKAVQEALSGRAFYETDEAWVVTNNSFTPKARELASKTGVRLLDGGEIVAWIMRTTKEEAPSGETVAESSRRRAATEARKRGVRLPHPDDPI